MNWGKNDSDIVIAVLNKIKEISGILFKNINKTLYNQVTKLESFDSKVTSHCYRVKSGGLSARRHAVHIQ